MTSKKGSSKGTTAEKVVKKVVRAKKSVAPKRVSARKPAASAPRSVAPQTVEAASPEVAIEARYELIAVAAYLRAESRHFAPGSELEDWVAAEEEIDARLAR